MAKPLQTTSVAAPGFFGLNSQESSVTLEPAYALEANNCIIDSLGRLGSRKGWQYLTQTGGVPLKGAHEFIDIDGSHTTISWSDTAFYTGVEPLVATTDNSTAFTSADFDSATLNDKAFFVQAGQSPRYYDPVGNTFENIAAAGNTVTNLSAISSANTCLSAYGRLWLADFDSNKTTFWWSDLLDGTNFDTGTAGNLDLSSILVRGNDEIVGIAAHVGRLIVFCKDNIVIFSDTDADQVLNPVNMQLVEVIRGVGCIARDSIQNTGSDVIFLAATGLLSLGRLIQEKSQPMRDLSRNVRDDLVKAVASEDLASIKSVYIQEDAFYLLLLPTYRQVYCFDMQGPLENGASRVTTWTNQTQTNMLAVERKLYFTQTAGIALYNGYTDNGASYVMRYLTSYFDFGDSTVLKIVKRLGATVIGGNGQTFTLKVGYDYSDNYSSYGLTLDNLQTFEYGIAEFGIAEYSIGTAVDQVRAPMGGDGSVIQMGLEATINGAALSIQRLDTYVKQGRIF